jgi:hypothetical protein
MSVPLTALMGLLGLPRAIIPVSPSDFHRFIVNWVFVNFTLFVSSLSCVPSSGFLNLPFFFVYFSYPVLNCNFTHKTWILTFLWQLPACFKTIHFGTIFFEVWWCFVFHFLNSQKLMWVDAVYATFRQLNLWKFQRFSFPFDSLILQCLFSFGAERFQCPFVVYPADRKGFSALLLYIPRIGKVSLPFCCISRRSENVSVPFCCISRRSENVSVPFCCISRGSERFQCPFVVYPGDRKGFSALLLYIPRIGKVSVPFCCISHGSFLVDRWLRISTVW